MEPDIVGLSLGWARLAEGRRRQLRMEPLQLLLNGKQGLDRKIFDSDSEFDDFDLGTWMRNSRDNVTKSKDCLDGYM